MNTALSAFEICDLQNENRKLRQDLCELRLSLASAKMQLTEVKNKTLEDAALDFLDIGFSTSASVLREMKD